MANYGLSKSRILSHLQCAKRLYLEIHRPELFEATEATEQKLAAGAEVGEVARRLHPDGVLVEAKEGLAQAIGLTRELMARKPARAIFEGTFQHDGVLVRVDILDPTARDTWNLIEVKASTRVKDVHLSDCAIQAWVLKGVGVRIPRIFLAHIDREFVYPGDGDYAGLFHYADVTEEVEPLLAKVASWASASRHTLQGPEPAIAPGPQCGAPYDCPFLLHCAPAETAEYPIHCLPKPGGIVEALRAEGYADLRDIPPGRLVSALHERVRAATVSGKAYLDPEAGRKLRGLPFPRYYLDFETIGFAVPIWAGTRPYQQLPFQWSCHIEDAPGRLRHEEFLDTSGAAPMRPLAERLLKTLGDRGPIFTYSSFEKRVINVLVKLYPDLDAPLKQLVARMVDLLPITRAHYYHRDMRGSWSIKSVVPTIAPALDYASLGEVQEGGAAQTAYLEAIAETTGADRRQELVEALRRYCGHDTLAMVELVRHFNGS